MSILKNFLLMIFILLGIGTANAQLIRPFTQRTSPFNPGVSIYNVKGDFTMIGNTNLSLQNYSDNSGNQNSMVYVDIDNDSATLNSSSANLNFSTENGAVPACSEVVFAGLYWTGRASNGPSSPNTFPVTKNGVTVNFDKQKIKLKGPSSSAYTDVIATTSDIYYPQNGDGFMYSAFAEVTDYVRNNGVLGAYTVADIALIEGAGGTTGFYGGWSLVVIYSNNNMRLRDITVFDGHAFVAGNVTADFTIPLSGFNATQSGPVNVKMGLIAGEGDRQISGDFFQIRNAANTAWVDLEHGGNSTTNFFNSSIFTGNNTRNPNLLNNTGLDISVFDLPNVNNSIIGNNQTSTTFRYGSNQDTYIIFGIVFSVDAYEPDIIGINTLTQTNGIPASASPSILPGQNLTYELDIKNIGSEDVVNGQIIIPVPYNANFVNANGQYFFTPNSGSAPFFNPTLGGNGSIVWNIGNLPLPTNPNTVLATLSYNLSATTECIILNNANCSEQISVNGTISGVGAITNTNLIEPFVSGFQQSGSCSGQPITNPINVPINAAAFVQANCQNVTPSYSFTFCNLDSATTIATSQISGSFPLGTRFFNTNPVTTASIEYTNSGFPAIAGTNTYYAYPQGINAPCFIELTITVILTPINSTPTANDQTYCLNEVATPLIATPSDSTFFLLFYTTPTGGSASSQITPNTSIAGNTIYYVTEGISSNCISSVRLPINVSVFQPGLSTLSGIDGTNSYQTTATVGQQLCFRINSNNPQSGIVLGLNYNNEIPSAVFTSAGSPFPAGNFCWTPTSADVGTNVFTVSVSDSCGGVNTFTYTIIVDPLPCQLEISITDVKDLVCSLNDGVAFITVSGGTAPYNFTVINNTTGEIFTNNTGIFTNLTAGSYSLVVSDAAGCQPDCSNFTFEINGSVTPISATATATSVLCADANSTGGSITVNVNGGTAPYLYSIGSGFVANNVFTGLSSGTYQVAVLDANGCSFTLSTTVTAPAPLVATIGGLTQELCGNSNGGFTVSASGGTAPYSYTINGNAASGNVFSGLAAGTYTVVVTDANNCSNSVIATITTPAPLEATVANLTQALCGNSNGGFEINVTGGTAPFVYNLNGIAYSANVFSGLNVGTYTVEITDANNCSTVVTAEITAPAQLTANSINVTQSLCGNNNGSFEVAVSGGTPAYQFNIGNGNVSSNVFNNLATGTYQVTVSDANNCTAIVRAEITTPEALSAVASNVIQPSCGLSNGSFEIAVTGGTAPFTYQVNGLGNASNIFSGLPNGVYTVNVTDANGCRASVSVTLNGTLSFTIRTSSTPVTCFGDCNGTATVSGTVPALTFVWSNGENTASISGLCAGTYAVTATDVKGCVQVSNVIVTQPDQILVSLESSSNETCIGNDGSATITASGGTTPFTFGLAGVGQSNTVSNNTGLFTGLQAGIYAYYATDSNGCIQECIGQFTINLDCNNNNGLTGNRSVASTANNYVLVSIDKSSTTATVNYAGNSDSKLVLSVLDVNGNQISIKPLTEKVGATTLEISRLNSANYFVILSDETGKVLGTGKMNIKR